MLLSSFYFVHQADSRKHNPNSCSSIELLGEARVKRTGTLDRSRTYIPVIILTMHSLAWHKHYENAENITQIIRAEQLCSMLLRVNISWCVTLP